MANLTYKYFETRSAKELLLFTPFYSFLLIRRKGFQIEQNAKIFGRSRILKMQGATQHFGNVHFNRVECENPNCRDPLAQMTISGQCTVCTPYATPRRCLYHRLHNEEAREAEADGEYDLFTVDGICYTCLHAREDFFEADLGDFSSFGPGTMDLMECVDSDDSETCEDTVHLPNFPAIPSVHANRHHFYTGGYCISTLRHGSLDEVLKRLIDWSEMKPWTVHDDEATCGYFVLRADQEKEDRSFYILTKEAEALPALRYHMLGLGC